MSDEKDDRAVRVLVAGAEADRGRLVTLVGQLGHTVLAGPGDAADVHGDVLTAHERPEVALISVGAHSAEALELIRRIVQQAACPAIAVLSAPDPGFVDAAAQRGVFAYIVDLHPEHLRSALAITLRRFEEYHRLQDAFGRRATIELAKGILMERHQVDERQAFERLREHARAGNRRVVDVARAVVEGHALLPGRNAPKD
jgi:AmiR/NasT family two-component response regulator